MIEVKCVSPKRDDLKTVKTVNLHGLTNQNTRQGSIFQTDRNSIGNSIQNNDDVKYVLEPAYPTIESALGELKIPSDNCGTSSQTRQYYD